MKDSYLSVSLQFARFYFDDMVVLSKSVQNNMDESGAYHDCSMMLEPI